jgi:hypothetical protein
MTKVAGLRRGDVVSRRDSELLTTEVDGELIAMRIDKGTCYGLNSVGTRIWALIAEPCSIDDLCDRLLVEFKVEDEVCRRDVLYLLEQLLVEGLVTVQPEKG